MAYRLAPAVLILVALVAARSPAVSPDPASLAVSAEQSAKARELVRRLGSESFRDRDQATRELEKMGRLAAAALAEVRDDPDPEVRMRVGLLLPRAEADDLKARVEAFLADADGKYDHDLPGWARFRAVAGDDPPARDLFVEVVKNPDNHPLLLALRGVPADRAAGLEALAGGVSAAGADQPPALDEALVARRQQIQYRVNPPFTIRPGGLRLPDVPDVALLLLAESLVSEAVVPAVGSQYQVKQFFVQGAGQAAAGGIVKYRPAFRRLAVRWLDTRDGLAGVRDAMNIARNVGLGDQAVARYAARLLALPSAPPWNKAGAAIELVKTHGTEHALRLPTLFNDSTPLLRGGGPNPEVTAGDTALAAALLLTRQDPRAYGFEPNPLVKQPGVQFSISHFRFRSDDTANADEKRERAIARWKDWELTQVGSALGTAAAARLIAVRMPEKDPAVVKAEQERRRAAQAAEDALP